MKIEIRPALSAVKTRNQCSHGSAPRGHDCIECSQGTENARSMTAFFAPL